MAQSVFTQNFPPIPPSFSAAKKDFANGFRTKQLLFPSFADATAWATAQANYPDTEFPNGVTEKEYTEGMAEMMNCSLYDPENLKVHEDFAAWFNSIAAAVAASNVVYGQDLTDDQIDTQSSEVVDTFDFDGFIKSIEFQGFDRGETRRMATKLIGLHGAIQIALIGSVRGVKLPRVQNFRIMRAVKSPTSGSSFVSVSLAELQGSGILSPSTPGLSKEVLTVGRIASAFAAETMFLLFKHGYSIKRVEGIAMPGWAQFPAAASVDLPGMDAMGCIFQREFSKSIKGRYNAAIYSAMRKNPIRMKDGVPWMILQYAWLNTTPSKTVTFAQAQAVVRGMNVGGTIRSEGYWELVESMNKKSRPKKAFNLVKPVMATGGAWERPTINGQPAADMTADEGDE